VQVDVVDVVARLVVAGIELLADDAAPDRGLSAVLGTSAPVNRPPDAMPASMNA
jgi:hypothetical protein